MLVVEGRKRMKVFVFYWKSLVEVFVLWITKGRQRQHCERRGDERELEGIGCRQWIDEEVIERRESSTT